MRTLSLALIAVSTLVARGDERLKGTWKVVAHQINGDCALRYGVGLRFDDANVTWLKDDPKECSIPLHGSVFGCHFDKSCNPHRLKIGVEEGGKQVFAYCIYDVHDDTLMIRMLFTLILTQDYVTDETRRQFLIDPYPKNFTSVKGDAAMLLILRRTDETSAGKTKQ